MAKPKLTQEMIEFIVSKYDSKTENNTFPEISKMLKDKYEVDVSYQAVHQNYHKYKKDNENITPEVVLSSEKQVKRVEDNTAIPEAKEVKTQIKSIAERRKGVKNDLTKSGKGYDTSLEEEYDIEALFTIQPTEDKPTK